MPWIGMREVGDYKQCLLTSTFDCDSIRESEMLARWMDYEILICDTMLSVGTHGFLSGR